MLITIQDIIRNFDSRDHAHGKAYQNEGRVRDLTFNADQTRVSALVKDSASAPFRVEVEIIVQKSGLTKIESYCTCPTGYMCKHGAAVLFEKIAQATRKHERRSSPLLKTKNRKKKDSLSWEAGEWLKGFDALLDSKEGDQEDRIIYFIAPDSAIDSGVKVIPAIQHQLRTGGWSRHRTLTSNQISTLASHNRILSAQDHEVLFLLERAGKDKPFLSGMQAAWALPPDAELIDLILTRIIGTGRGFLYDAEEDVPSAPLNLGPAIWGDLTWVPVSETAQKPALVPQESCLVLLRATSPWYINSYTRQAGPLTCDLEKRLLGAFLKAPAIEDHEARLIRKHIELKSLSIPSPLSLKINKQKPNLPRPRIRIMDKRPDDTTIAFFSFVYDGDIEVAPSCSLPFYSQKTGEEWRLSTRNKIAEKTILDELAAQGLALLQLHDTSDPLIISQRLMPATSTSPWFWLDFHYLIIDRLKDAGFEVIDETLSLPQTNSQTESFGAIIEPDTADIEASFTQTGAWWFSLDLGVSVNGKRIPLLPLLVAMLHEIHSMDDIEALTLSGKCYVPMEDGRRLAMPADRMRSILKMLVELYDEKPLLDDGSLRVSMDLAAAFLTLEAITRKRWIGESKLRKLVEKLSSFDGIRRHAVPKGLRAALRPYQSEGYNWLHFLGEYGLSGILADDMGLGKTVQALAYLLSKKETGELKDPCLIVMPTSLVANWQAELARFTPDIKVLTFHGKDRMKSHAQIKKHDLVITTYPLLTRDSDELKKIQWDIVVLDEAQAIKNPSAKMTQAACELKARQRLCLTGTPVENHLGEAWSLFTFLIPGLLGDHSNFARHYRTPIEKEGDAERKALFARRLRPFVLRRMKNDVAKDLPEKTEIVHRISMSEAQQDLYEAVRHAMDERVREEIKAKGLGRSHIVVLDALLKLRQTCCDPRLVALEAARHVQESAKLEALLDMLPTLIEEGRRVLLFSQFTSMLDLIKPELKKLDIPFVELRGSTKDRKTPIDRFQREEVPLFLISLKAGGTGLNLTAADTVIHYDPWWNPSVENQATDRAHRIGQDKPVFVYKLIVKDSVEERILELQERKADLAGALFGDKPAAAASLTQDDINWLIGR